VRQKDGLILGTIPEMQYGSAVVNGPVVYCIGVTTTALEFAPPTSDTIQTRILWTSDLEGTFYASPVFDNGLLYAASNEGNFYVLDAKDGKIIATKELEINNASGRFNPPANIYPSLSIAGKFLFVGNDAAEMLVLEPGRDYKELHKNKLSEGSGGTPVFAGAYIYFRDGSDLICVGEK
jgi:outer membrane protein assembly factor BamB